MDSPSIGSDTQSESVRSAYQGSGGFGSAGWANDTTNAPFTVDQQSDANAHRAAETMRRLSYFASWLDDRFAIPGTKVRFGMDTVIGLVPGVGDLVGAALSSYIVFEGRRLGIPKRLTTKMVGNIAVDAAIGAIPIIGDLADIHWKANRKNVHLLMNHLRSRHGSRVFEAV